jgi:hypothetical protein
MLRKLSSACLVLCALFEICRYDLIARLYGSANIGQRLGRQPVNADVHNSDLVQGICDSLVFASCLYFKPVLCLQRSVCLVRLLRKRGVFAQLVIGYRPNPFFSHAWVEVGGRIVNDSPLYQQRLRVLYTA